MGAESVSVAAVRRLRGALAALDPGIPYVTLTNYADGRLSRSTLTELRQADSTVVPLWSTVWMFVLACLSYADEQSIEVPAPLRDLGHWQHLYDECRAQGGNVLSGTVYGAVVQADTINGVVDTTGRRWLTGNADPRVSTRS
jgi:hypothetical protein